MHRLIQFDNNEIKCYYPDKLKINGKYYEGQRLIELVLASMPVKSAILSLRKKMIVWTNNTDTKNLGYENFSLVGVEYSLEKLFHPDDQEKIFAKRKAMIGDKEKHSYRILGKDGQWHWMMSWFTVLGLDEEANVDLVLATAFECKDEIVNAKALHGEVKSLNDLIDRMKIKQNQMKLEHRQAENEILSELNRKNNEISNIILNLIAKNESLVKIREKMLKLNQISDDPKINDISDFVLDLIEDKMNMEDTWSDYQNIFEALHRDFTKNLIEAHPDLSPVELKICSLLRIKLSSKEIADVLNVSPRTIETHRFRIRKKLKLNSKIHLPAYFEKF